MGIKTYKCGNDIKKKSMVQESKYEKTYYRYLISVETFEVVGLEVRWIPVSSMV